MATNPPTTKARVFIAERMWKIGWKLIQISGHLSGQEWFPPVPKGPTRTWEISSPHDDGSVLIRETTGG